MFMLHYIVILIITIAGLSSFFNESFFKFSKTIGFTVFSMIFSLILTLSVKAAMDLNFLSNAKDIHYSIQKIDFQYIVMNYLVGYLLFATALHTNIVKLKSAITKISYLATVGVIVSAIITGGGMYMILGTFGLNINLGACLIFGALISPTDPVAVMSVLKKNKSLSSDLKITIIGESLFNDATGILLLTIFTTIFSGVDNTINFKEIMHLMYHEVFLTILFVGVFGSLFGKFVLKKIRSSQTGILLTISSAGFVYLFCQKNHMSAPLAMVIFGLLSGYFLNLSPLDTNKVNDFWGIVDDILNSCLFVLIGLKVLSMNFSILFILIGIGSILVISMSRYFSILIPLVFNKKYTLKEKLHYSNIMTLGGVRGGISLALALSLAHFPTELIYITYIVVILSIVFQSTFFDKYLLFSQKNEFSF